MRKIQVVTVVIQQDGKFLVGKRSPAKKSAGGYWCPVSGSIEAGETQEQAVVREVWEEVGLRVEPLEKLGELETRDKSAVMHWWTVRITGGSAFLKNEEHTELRWVTLEEMRQLQPFFEEDLAFYEKVHQ